MRKTVGKQQWATERNSLRNYFGYVNTHFHTHKAQHTTASGGHMYHSYNDKSVARCFASTVPCIAFVYVYETLCVSHSDVPTPDNTNASNTQTTIFRFTFFAHFRFSHYFSFFFRIATVCSQQNLWFKFVLIFFRFFVLTLNLQEISIAFIVQLRQTVFRK